jgi:hypothetical protein
MLRLRRSGRRGGYHVACSECKTPGTASHPKPEATYLKGVHDELHHRGVPTATVKRTR